MGETVTMHTKDEKKKMTRDEGRQSTSSRACASAALWARQVVASSSASLRCSVDAVTMPATSAPSAVWRNSPTRCSSCSHARVMLAAQARTWSSSLSFSTRSLTCHIQFAQQCRKVDNVAEGGYVRDWHSSRAEARPPIHGHGASPAARTDRAAVASPLHALKHSHLCH